MGEISGPYIGDGRYQGQRLRNGGRGLFVGKGYIIVHMCSRGDSRTHI